MPPASPSSAAPIRARPIRLRRESRCGAWAAMRRAARCCCSTACPRPIPSAAGSPFPPIFPCALPVRESCGAGAAAMPGRVRSPARSSWRVAARRSLAGFRSTRSAAAATASISRASARSSSGAASPPLPGNMRAATASRRSSRRIAGRSTGRRPMNRPPSPCAPSPASAPIPSSRPISRPSPTAATAAWISRGRRAKAPMPAFASWGAAPGAGRRLPGSRRAISPRASRRSTMRVPPSRRRSSNMPCPPPAWARGWRSLRPSAGA